MIGIRSGDWYGVEIRNSTISIWSVSGWYGIGIRAAIIPIGNGGRHGSTIPVETKDVCDICCKGNKEVLEDVLLAI